MKEKTKALIITAILLALGALTTYLSTFNLQFTFEKTELSFDNNLINEKLTYITNKDYHTLYRDFQTPVYATLQNFDTITPEAVTCIQGEGYFHTKTQCDEEVCRPYTESNEYGCTFGETLGFKKENEYTIEGSYSLNPGSIIEINNKHYTKFVAYSPNKHPLLIKGKNFIVPENAITKSYFLPQQYVTLYVPYEINTENYRVIKQNSFEYNKRWLLALAVILAILPALIFYFAWNRFGKESSHTDFPESLSYYPDTKRKGWEVAAYFNPPFGKIDNNFFAALILELNRRKIILLKTIGKETYIKVQKENDPSLDEVEKMFIKKIF